ncbi:MAG TPA: hypothetical protein VHF25_09930, partial [Nitriliruptorales bacterium]|nr:hypothetical protein [Nitriliruptorales bacterium]
ARMVVAHSMGGAVTLLAMRDGMRLDAVALLAPAVRLEHALAPFQRRFHIPDGAMAGLRARIEDRFGSDVWTDVAADRIAAELDVPALVVHDLTDRQVDHSDVQLLVAAWRTATLTTSTGLGHMRILRDPEVTDQIVTFLTSHLPDREPTPQPASRLALRRAAADRQRALPAVEAEPVAK